MRARMGIHVQAHMHARRLTHFRPKQWGAAFLNRMGLFNKGLKNGGIPAGYEVIMVKCADLQVPLILLLYFDFLMCHAFTTDWLKKNKKQKKNQKAKGTIKAQWVAGFNPII